MFLKAFPFYAVLRILGAMAAGLLVAEAGQTIRVPLANGFDLPVGKPDAAGYYVFRGYYPGGHLGEDWNGNAGGDTDLGDPVYASGAGVVVFSEDYLRGWGNVVIVRHAYLDESGRVALLDSLYGHLDKRMVRKYQMVQRGQQLGTIGTAHGKYAAHLHFEMRKNIKIGMARSAFDQGYSNYFSPRQFIATRRTLRSGANVVVPVDTFGGQDGDADDGPPKPPELTKGGGDKADPKPKPKSVAVPTRDPVKPAPPSKEVADNKSSDSKSKTNAEREAALQKLIEENRKRVELMKDEDLDGFWARLKKKLNK
jgi:murein DD-endopeptidase MepM/ murein hydrolase activator NlpD